MKQLMMLSILILYPFVSLNAWAERTLVWNKLPLTIVLPVGEEIRVTFPTDVTLQLPMSITEQLESLAPNQQVVYWKAKAPFDSIRAIATANDNESVYLIDLVARAGAISEHLHIEDPDRVVHQQASNADQSFTSDSIQELLDPPEILLTRFASQSLYAPRRLMPVSSDIYAQPISLLPPTFPLMRSQSGEQFRYSVVGAWSGYGRYITAVMITNLSPISIQINPGLLTGNFTHVTAQHLTLGASGSLEDRTTLYLISNTPFASAIMEDGYGY